MWASHGRRGGGNGSTERMPVLLIATALAVTSWTAPPAAAAPPDGKPAPATSCEFIDIPETDEPWRQSVAADEDGAVWLISGGRLFTWTGQEFREATPGASGFGSFVGERDRGVYATQRERTAGEDVLYRLRDGAARPVCTYYVDGRSQRPPVYVSRSGRLFNWGNRYVAVWQNGKWERIEALLSREDTLAFDLGDEVYFYYDNSLYCVDADGNLSERDCPRWVRSAPERSVAGVLWAGRRALLVGPVGPALFAFDLPTGERIDMSSAILAYGDRSFGDVFALGDGDVRILGAAQGGPAGAVFRLSPDGVLTEVPGTRGVPWRNSHIRQHPHSVLETSTGDLVFGLAWEGLAVCRDGAVSVWGWRHRLTQSVHCLCEDASGAIWFAQGDKVVRLRLAAGPPPLSPTADAWEEFALVPHTDIWQLAPGEVAMFRRDHPAALSRWDGRAWRHQRMPFDTSKTGKETAVDDRGHLLVSTYEGDGACFDIGPGSVKRFGTMEALLENAVADGAREFPFIDGFAGIMVMPDGRAWYGMANRREARMWDGSQWQTLSFDSDVYALQRSYKHGVLFRTQGGRFYRHDQGQVLEVHPSLHEGGKLVLSERGLWPYEQELVAEDPDRYFPVFKWRDACFLFLRPDEFESASRVRWPDAYETATGALKPPEAANAIDLPEWEAVVRQVPSGGVWILGHWGSGVALRVLNGKAEEVHFSDTPLAKCEIRNILEDGAGNLWFRTYYPKWLAHRRRATDAR